jgi:hypothetical protein
MGAASAPGSGRVAAKAAAEDDFRKALRFIECSCLEKGS